LCRYYTEWKQGMMEKQGLAFERLHALVRKGYTAEIGEQSDDRSIALRHLGKAPDLRLHADGRIEPLDARIPRHKRRLKAMTTLPAEREADQLAFMRFLDTVPKATLRDRTRPFRRKYFYIPAAVLIFWGLSLMFTVIIANGM
jgi:hypothetical protein